MAHSKQAFKRIRTSEKAREANKRAASTMRGAMKRVLQAPTRDEAVNNLAAAQKRIDKAAKTGVIHKNAAARRKSRLARAAAKLAAAGK